MARLGYPYYQAHYTNFSVGRERPIRYIAIHHSAGWEDTLRYLWASPSRNASSHFWVGNLPGQIEQYIDTNDTSWANNNWTSNNESITIETRGDWRGYYDKGTLDNLYLLMVKILEFHPGLGIIYHKDVSTGVTLCPADLKDLGYARQQYDRALSTITSPPPPPTRPEITYEAITPKRIILNISTNLWNFDFVEWEDADPVKAFGAGHIVDVVAIATNGLDAKYYMTAYAWDNGNIRSTHGFNLKDCSDYVPPVEVLPPQVTPQWEPMENPRRMRLISDNYVTDLDANASIGKIVPAGSEIELVEKKATADSVMWVRSKWSRDNNKNWGIQLDRFEEIPPPNPTPNPPEEPPVEIPPEPPINVDPDDPTDDDVPAETLSAIYKLLKAIAAFFGIKIGDDNNDKTV